MTTFHVRRARPDDVDALERHRIRMFEDMGRLPAPGADVSRLTAEYGEWLVTMMASGTYVSWVVDAEALGASTQIVAGGGATIIPWPPGPFYPGDRAAFIYNVYTEPEFRGRGCARMIMDAVHAFCRASGIRSVMLNASEFGQPLYESMGYRVAPSPMMFLSLR
jgi:GNAT superfamily N-acetyltransferase